MLTSFLAAITSFAAQLVAEYMEKQMKSAVLKEKGLHTFTTGGEDIKVNHYGSETLNTITQLFETEQHLVWSYLTQLATPKFRNHRSWAKDASVNDRAVSRKDRPAEIKPVCQAADKGLLYFAYSANCYLFALESRNGSSTSYHATYDALKKYAKSDGEHVCALGRDMKKSGICRIDNVQKFVHPHNHCIGCEAHMLIGTAAMVFKMEGFQPGMLDLNEKQENLTFDDLWDMIDHDYLSVTFAIQWLKVLVDFIPALQPYAAKVCKLSTTISAKHCLKTRHTKIHTLPTNSYNETMVNIFGHLGQTAESYIRRLLLVRGDGLTYEQMVQLKNYLQFQDTPYEWLDLLEPFLEIWHTVWTHLSQIYQAHWVSLKSRDPSTIGYGTNSIKRKAPGNLGKVEYYQYSDLLHLEFDARMIDIWSNKFLVDDLTEYFNTLAADNELPTFEHLHSMAQQLHMKYGTAAAFHFVIRYGNTHGTEWTPPARDSSSMDILPPSSLGKRLCQCKLEPSEDKVSFNGDKTLARSTRFICDALLSRQAVIAMAEGDVGCVWECLKTMIFTFAGSLHTKYTGYLLEMVCNFELEAGPNLRELFFKNWLVCPSGIPGHFMAGGLLQEQLQDELYEHIQSKDSRFDENYIRNIITPNMYQFMRVKKDIQESLGLCTRSGHHITPSKSADLHKLISIYQSNEVHRFQKGRTYAEANVWRVDDLGHGVQSLQAGRLDKWVKDTCCVHFLNAN
ncbi:hypothetical protein ARMGADRAFT_1048108 [Armillaria gallica]|uniref:DUF6589 domain-containing protein n=1 Tax=Armillaria gallica TaxID=47427 RepID=A0A2H3CUM0_ARMGA|nr:hypothetical protein ARMGADRAFT_1048108 [Armillaria gallica]